MENRIKVNDIWYVREDTIKDEIKKIDVDINKSIIFTLETDLYCWEAIKQYEHFNSSELNDDLFVTFTDKRYDEPIVEHWDNIDWFFSIYENDKASCDLLIRLMGEEGFNYFYNFISKLIENDFLKK